ncbi:hypothetical protein [Aurantibacillus circumpalustris]|uniref:hypothetical protein n=1 Tax=Aurantibacillus circumpalustris TaxID=3036359 RepID=UPI00295B5154|nr:hypothetical protein [Aurantibacillus circumpalustris]
MKKSSSFVVITVLVILVGISIYIFRSKSVLSTVDGDERNFSYKDTASITRIFIADKDGHKVDLKRTNKAWVVNDKYDCRNDAILNLLELIKQVEVKMPAPKNLRKSILKYMSTQALKVEIYKGDELVKQFYVGHETEDSGGSYMLLTDVATGKNFKDPYACFIPGFNGYLLPRFITNENEWRDRIVMNFTPPELKQITFKNLNAPDSSFTIELINANSFKLKDNVGKEISFNDAAMRQYLVYLQNVSYEVLLTGKNKKLQDSLIRVRPFVSIFVTTKNNKTETFNFYRKQFLGDINPEHGVTYDYDPDRMYLSFSDDKEWALVQYFVFGKLLVNSNYFTAADPVKK